MKAARNNPFKQKVSFNVWFDGEVRRVSLASGESVNFRMFRYTDEGYSTNHMNVTRSGNELYMSEDSDGRDCDGRMSSSHTGVCHISKRAAHKPYRHHDEPRCRDRYPRWDNPEYSQRDYQAEAAGY